ncbi:uncharacterized transmembrane protein DDB_G0289901-like [Topomyia yanbarensis]|uniref:uncharacterized transmembrane protein DDB_G0289901-like n=1 Tax=Topomyia yanbarensis TaxID=2498891 RepID=UPI00273C4D8C|nr:uncharacterized transmembrane protein DDB_G0289901-like [Topomyia yanbarensis]
MNSFIQELRNISSSSSASSNSSFDSGFSASFAGGDSNGGSGRATALNHQQQQQQQQQNIIWGNKSLWGRPPPSPSPSAKTSSTPATESSNINGNNSMYASKDPQSSSSTWNTTASPSLPSQSQSPPFPQSIWENSATNATESLALTGPGSAASLGSIWMIPESSSRSVWGEPPSKPNSQLLRPAEIGSSSVSSSSSNTGGGGAVGIGCGSKLSSLWAPNAAIAPAVTASAASGNVLKSLRLAGTVGAGGGPSSSFGLGGLTTTPTGGGGGGGGAATSSLQLFSDEFLSYLNINN